MTTEKFSTEVETLKKFFTTFCHNRHKDQQKFFKVLTYNDKNFEVDLHLCKECSDLLNYAFNRLLECPYETKPRCRTCQTPCYEKDKWKKTAKLMMYSGMKLGLTRIRKFAMNLFKTP